MVMSWLEPLFRWIHVVAGVLWIGHLYFFNFVNGPFEKTLEAGCSGYLTKPVPLRELETMVEACLAGTPPWWRGSPCWYRSLWR